MYLRLIIKARIWTAIGSGGVLYLSPIIFNSLGFTAEQIGSGITIAAFAGITSRFGTGYLLDKKFSYAKAIKVACLLAILSDCKFGFFLGIRSLEKANTILRKKNIIANIYFNDLSSIFFLINDNLCYKYLCLKVQMLL